MSLSLPNPCRLATRQSPLALRQSEIVADLIREKSNVEVQLVPMTTSGDRRMDWSLQREGGKGLFTKELEQAVLDGQADLAVHSAKDMPTDSPDGLKLCAFLERDDPRDVLVTREGVTTIRKIASGSPRRISQLKNRYPEAEWLELRGNVETRLRKIAEAEEADATVLAAAGLNRLKIQSYPGLRFQYLPVDEMVPAPGQAAIALQTKTDMGDLFSSLGHRETNQAVELERKVLAAMGGGCQVALGVYVSTEAVHFFHEETGVLSLDLQRFKKDDDLIKKLTELIGR